MMVDLTRYMLLIRITIIFKFALIVIIHLDNVNDGSHGAHTLRVKWGASGHIKYRRKAVKSFDLSSNLHYQSSNTIKPVP